MASDSEKLDFTSEHFDAETALSSSETKVPIEEVQTFSSLTDFFKAITKKEEGQPIAAAQEQTAKAVAPVAHLSLEKLRELRHKRLVAMAKKRNPEETEDEPSTSRRPRTRLRNILSVMDSFKGPLGMLYKCMQQRIRVKIWTRSHTKIRGICTGFILAFDHHWNLALSDVEETFAVSAKAKIPAIGDPKAKIREVKVTEPSKPEEQQTDESNSQKGGTEQLPSAAQDTEEDIAALTRQLEFLQHQLSLLPDDKKEREAAQRSTAKKPVATAKAAAVAATLLRGNVKMRVYERHVNQIFLRGDNIVLIAILEC